mgnify:CR=1 FL=1
MNATAIMTTTTKMEQEKAGAALFLNIQDLPANAPRPMVEGYEKAAREFEFFAQIHKDRFNTMY